MVIKIVNLSANELPKYATSGASGLDLQAVLEFPILLNPMERVLISTGLSIEIPSGLEAQVRPRSGLALKKGITCLNTPGTIDSDYRGEIKVILINLSNEPQTIQNQDRIAQLVFAPVVQIKWEEVSLLNESKRNQGGFGHTG